MKNRAQAQYLEVHRWRRHSRVCRPWQQINSQQNFLSTKSAGQHLQEKGASAQSGWAAVACIPWLRTECPPEGIQPRSTSGHQLAVRFRWNRSNPTFPPKADASCPEREGSWAREGGHSPRESLENQRGDRPAVLPEGRRAARRGSWAGRTAGRPSRRTQRLLLPEGCERRSGLPRRSVQR